MPERADQIYLEAFDMSIGVIVLAAQKRKLGLDPNVVGMAIQTEDNGFYFVLPLKWDEGTVWHEAHHMARFINSYHGIITTWDDHEADAYLQEYIVRLLKETVYFRK